MCKHFRCFLKRKHEIDFAFRWMEGNIIVQIPDKKGSKNWRFIRFFFALLLLLFLHFESISFISWFHRIVFDLASYYVECRVSKWQHMEWIFVLESLFFTTKQIQAKIKGKKIIISTPVDTYTQQQDEWYINICQKINFVDWIYTKKGTIQERMLSD